MFQNAPEWIKQLKYGDPIDIQILKAAPGQNIQYTANEIKRTYDIVAKVC